MVPRTQFGTGMRDRTELGMGHFGLALKITSGHSQTGEQDLRSGPVRWFEIETLHNKLENN